MKYIILAAVLSLVACGDKEPPTPVGSPAPVVDVAPPVVAPIVAPVYVTPDKAMTMEELGPKPAGGSAGYPDWVKACDRITGAFCN